LSPGALPVFNELLLHIDLKLIEVLPLLQLSLSELSLLLLYLSHQLVLLALPQPLASLELPFHLTLLLLHAPLEVGQTLQHEDGRDEPQQEEQQVGHHPQRVQSPGVCTGIVRWRRRPAIIGHEIVVLHGCAGVDDGFEALPRLVHLVAEEALAREVDDD